MISGSESDIVLRWTDTKRRTTKAVVNNKTLHTNAHVSERALREIYLKGFEISVRTAQPLSIMTSYNLLNGVHTANNYDPITAIARDEWGGVKVW